MPPLNMHNAWVSSQLQSLKKNLMTIYKFKQEKPAVADKPARRLRNVCTVYVRAVGL